MTDKQFTFIMIALRDIIRNRVHNREICIEYNPENPCPEYRKGMFVLIEDVDKAILNSFNEILEDEYMI